MFVGFLLGVVFTFVGLIIITMIMNKHELEKEKMKEKAKKRKEYDKQIREFKKITKEKKKNGKSNI